MMWRLIVIALSVVSVQAGIVKHMAMGPDNQMTWDDFEGQNLEEAPAPIKESSSDEVDWEYDEAEEDAEAEPSDMIGVKTIIAIEFDKDMFDSVFLLGGYTGSSVFTCEGPAPENPCSIPIRHLPPEGVSVNYTDWLKGDNFLDLMGPEEDQGSNNDVPAAGTPMRKMEPWAALSRCNSDTSGKQTKTTRDRNKSTFWLVELDMDCSETYGFFEVKVVGRLNNSGKLWYEHDIQGKTSYDRAVDESCVGGIGGDIPFISESHMGYCGLANIFYYKKSYCEVNKIID